jgi:23S rRNA (adenine2503-C2)-methyltransferase
MKVVAKIGREDIATVYIAENQGENLIEFVESLQPPLPREKKWVLTISTLYGCPVGCRFCDAGGYYQGKLSTGEILYQIDYLIKERYQDKQVAVEKLKIQFARTGEPSFNENVLEVLRLLPELYDAPGLMISFSTIAPRGTEKFLGKLLRIKNENYVGKFQFQFSLHTTNEALRDWLIPMNKWSFKQMAEFGQAFHQPGDRKITLNFALSEGMPVDSHVLLDYFDPSLFLIKITPVNPTFQARKNHILSYVRPDREKYEIIEALKQAGYEVILSIGELEENWIGSNCGQYVTAYKNAGESLEGGFVYDIRKL